MLSSADLSVVICTYNRCESLRQTLHTCCDLIIPEELCNWELIVADNNSSDNTRDVCESFSQRIPLRYIFEPRQGKSYALNRVLEETSSGLLLFTDDDVDLDRMWLYRIWAAARQHTSVLFFGGRVYPRWQTAPPSWVSENSHPYLNYVFVRYDLGDAPRFLDETVPPFFGANLAFRRQAFDARWFNVKLGPQGLEQIHGEETEMQTTLLGEGQLGLYVPEAIVHHRNSNERMTERYLRQYFKGAGIREVRLSRPGGIQHFWFGVPRHLWLAIIKRFVHFLVLRATSPASAWIDAEIEMARTWGQICEWRRLSKLAGEPRVNL